MTYLRIVIPLWVPAFVGVKKSPPAHSRGRGNPAFAKSTGLCVGKVLGPRFRGDEPRKYLQKLFWEREANSNKNVRLGVSTAKDAWLAQPVPSFRVSPTGCSPRRLFVNNTN